MGCDIHLYTEYRGKDGQWHPAEPWIRDEEQDAARVPSYLCPITDRQYNFFAWLADVRNGTWGEPVPVLSAPRGLPADCCKEIRDCSNEWNGDGHSHSFFTRQELDEGFEKAKAAEVWLNGAVRVGDPQLQEWLAQPEETRGCPPTSYCASGTNCEPRRWKQPLNDLIGDTVYKLVDYLGRVAWRFRVNADADVRCVFWFDN